MKKLVTLAGCAALCAAFVLPSIADDSLVTIGGHMKGPVLTDNVWGDYMVNGVKGSGGYSAGTYFSGHAFILYASKDISDNVSVHAYPGFDNSGAGATPTLGKALGANLKTTSGSITPSLHELTVNYNLPDAGVHLRAGYMSTYFTMDYGHELFWGEEFNGGNYTLRGGSWHDSGLEAYKAFEFGNYSLPTYLYILNGNGSDARDNNNSRAVMLHVEPQFGPVKVFGSYGTGYWGDAVASSSGTLIGSSEAGQKNKSFYRWTFGAEYAYKRFTVRGEMGANKYDGQLANGNANAYNHGMYLKGFYTILPEKLTAMVHYDNYVDNATNGAGTKVEKFDTTYVGLNYDMAPSATLMLGYTYGNWRDNVRDYVKFHRIETAVRVTF